MEHPSAKTLEVSKSIAVLSMALQVEASTFATGRELKMSISLSGPAENIGVPVSIDNGGSGQDSAQEAIDALTQVSSATNEHVLTKDTATGNAIFKAASGGYWTDSATNVYLTTTTDDVIIGNTSPVSSAKFTVDGEADQRQCVIQGHSTQTDNILEVQKSDGTVLFGVTNTAGMTVGGSTTIIQPSTTNADLDLRGNGTGNVTIGDGTDTTKEISFEVSGATTAKTLTVSASHTDNRTLTIPDATTTMVGIDVTQTLTNKRVTPRVSSETSSATPTINTDNVDCHSITALAAAITSFTSNLSGTPTNFQKLTIRIKDDGTGRAITWGASFEAVGVALPTTTVANKRLTVGFLYDTVAAKWGCVASISEA